MKYDLVNPCKECPFRNDIPPYLTVERVVEIWNSLHRSEFPCHETVTYDDDGEPIRGGDKERHCAGALILKEKMGDSSQMMRICERLGMYDRSKLNMDAPVFDEIEDMIDCQES